ncbi:MAG: hypothetical protein JGK30_24420 [Microcoleus sp. PH2017_40_RAT_O_B]|uniref:hypothetical protein n=1 Tax=Microcoleus sp. PH2017_40_RAT_O_B TaxID=2798850 RepID=UPI001DC4299D|nr:hypothetical protein [Microcoleus sp. PH2017_40_RAT_O_B]MCC3612536.1 hypothetical protein [Microcoleus sp. PH2017_40_RAT_O_B]
MVILKEEGRRKKEEGRRKKEEGRRKKEEGRRKKEEGRRKKRRKKEEGVGCVATKNPYLHIDNFAGDAP